ncbi:hypothetical protein GGI25_001784 [Coemansia spiralis]|uniref:Peptide hydrolase n=2 Tax=Coemansia TaxID=4863 RepID=A0A9W8G562_9FUNG|nr:hypothetical protein EDC05_001921 [Coemansia umbellata]KAJ2618723.1 hypothetical protein GGI26_006398 [Coemansia sp. RSA 1358]KAJ2679012.1 hypothetical protein GGI25_001784 [Coemansia spiralis]
MAGLLATNGQVHSRLWPATVAATVLQFVVFGALLLFVADSLIISSVSSRILGRDVRPDNNYIQGSKALHTERSASEQQFDVQRALDHLNEIARTPHSLNDPRSIDVRSYLRKAIEQIIDGSNAEFSDPEKNGTVAQFKAKGSLVYWEDSSLIVRVPGTSDSREALLVQAHYDAVPMSHGAYDDGVGVVVCLELLQNLVQHPARHPVVINIDWGEENGLFGAMLFARFHPWADDVRAYINLEAGGVGGRAMVFRASHPALLSAYKQAAPAPCASLIGNSAFKLSIVKSDTDYSIYTTRYGVPGLDFAFTDHRSLYHTVRDNSDMVVAESILSMGVATLSTARFIADSASILPSIPRSLRLPERPHPVAGRSARALQAADESFGDLRENITIRELQHIVVAKSNPLPNNAIQDAVFYDILSRFMVVRSYTADTFINVLTGVLGIATIVGIQYPFVRPLPGSSDRRLNTAAIAEFMQLRAADRLVLQLGRGGFFGSLLEGTFVLAKAWGAGLLLSFVFTGVLIRLVMPRLAYTHVFLFSLLLFSASALGVTRVLTTWASRSHMPDIRSMVWYSWCLLRCIVLLAVVVPLGWAEIGLLYREQLYAWASIVAAILTALLDKNTALYNAWHRYARLAVSRITENRRSFGDPSSETLLHNDSPRDNEHLAIGPDAESGAPSQNSTIIIVIIPRFLSAMRFVLGVVLPLIIGMDTMLRQLLVLKDHLVDGSPPMACIAIASLDAVTFILFMTPYVVDSVVDIDGCWPMRYIISAVSAALERLPGSFGHTTLASRDGQSSRSQISLHTNHGNSTGYTDSESLHSATSSPGVEATPHLLDHDNESEDERIIDLGPSGNAIRRNHNNDNGDDDDNNDDDGDDDGLGRRHNYSIARKGEPPEVVGRRMVFTWAGIWLFLFILSQMAMLLGREYNSLVNPLKVRAFQTTYVSAGCLEGKEPGKGKCAYSTLELSSPDSNGLARLISTAVPENSSHVCFTRSVRDFYQCNIVVPTASQDDTNAFDNSIWSPESAINVTSVSHETQATELGTTLFTVTLNFSAPETRTCFIDFGNHRGFSHQSYPNPAPKLPPAATSLIANTLYASPAIERTVLPVIERTWFVNGISGKPALISEPIADRDAIYSGRIFAHKQEFDSQGQFSAVIQYTMPVANATRPETAVVDISCYFDVAERHVPLLTSIVGASPDWAVFTPAGNVLSTVTIQGIKI